jgi:zeta-carotene isomerase
LWCLAHTLWVGNSFMVATSLGLMAHHAFGCWHGDRRLKDKYGDAFEKVWNPIIDRKLGGGVLRP